MIHSAACVSICSKGYEGCGAKFRTSPKSVPSHFGPSFLVHEGPVLATRGAIVTQVASGNSGQFLLESEVNSGDFRYSLGHIENLLHPSLYVII